ncbi:MAG TPA: hypothetical protein VE173_02070, partial [Longimicrobiales bacterium]|nr:hypothetical protein [Longimicrobiales bacterium]
MPAPPGHRRPRDRQLLQVHRRRRRGDPSRQREGPHDPSVQHGVTVVEERDLHVHGAFAPAARVDGVVQAGRQVDLQGEGR